MKLARFWARQPGEALRPDGGRIRVVSRGWSNDSLEAARAAARDVAARLAARLASGLPAPGQYLYGDRPLPEPVIREFRNGGSAPAAVVTRNVYGSLVLNARELMFIDIDREDVPASAAGGLLAGVFSLFGNAAAAPAPAANALVDSIRRTGERNGLAGRVYRTAAGYRVLIANARFDATSPAAESLLREFDADPLYTRLCRGQETFRARLTPKPWRCGASLPPVHFPFETPREESRFQEWAERYSSRAARFATCRHVADFGGARLEPGFEELVRYHDDETKAGSDLPLA